MSNKQNRLDRIENNATSLPNTQPHQFGHGEGAPRKPAELRSQPTPFLTEAEEIALLRAIEHGTQEGFIEEEAIQVFEWASKTRLNQHLLDLTLEGRLAIKFREGKIVFVAPKALAAEESPKAWFAAMSKKFGFGRCGSPTEAIPAL
jgi:hypothetical protein